MKFLYSLYLCTFVFTVSADIGSYAVHEKRTAGTVGWHKRSRPHSRVTLPMRVALAQENLDTAAEYLSSVSDPKSVRFSQYWNAKEVAEKFAPSKQTVEEVVEWLDQWGIAQERLTRSHSGGWLYFNATVQEVERLLKTTYHLYERSDTRDTQIACEEYSLPKQLRKRIDFMSPTVHLGKAIRGHENFHPGPRVGKVVHPRTIQRIRDLSADLAATSLRSCAQYTTIDCLRALYNIPVSQNSHPNNSFGIFEAAWVSWLPGDLDKFFGTFMPPLTGHRPLMELIDGGYQQPYQSFYFNAEADLDMEYAMSLVYPQNVTNYQVGNKFLRGTLNDLLAAVDKSYCGALDSKIEAIYPDHYAGGYNSSDCGSHSLTSVISVSYSNNEVAYPSTYEERECLEYLKLGLQGVTIIVGSGDFGVAGLESQCVNPNTNQTTSTGNFNPGFPATCPYVTSVGGTQLPVNGQILENEEALYHSSGNYTITSGGGFSNVFAAPQYQRYAVQEYLHNQRSHLKNFSNKFNFGGRGFPDVSANAANYVTAIDGQFMTVRGTSASAPVFASIITKINDVRLSIGKRPVGFLNFVLYANSHVMNDIVCGSNYGCGVEALKAVKGWDPVTGLGTPDYKRMLDLYLALP